MVINDDGSVSFLDKTKEIKDILSVLNFEETLEFWKELEKNFVSQNLYADFIRNMCLVDRFFLLCVVLNRPDACHPWLFKRIREVEKDPDGHLDLWPRGHYKSTSITFAGSIQAILKNPEETICIFSFSKQGSKAFLEQVRQELEVNQLLKSVFPDILYENPARDAQNWSIDKGITVKRKTNPKEPTLMASGVVDGQPTGKHFTLRIYDDLVTDDGVNTPEMIQKTTDKLAMSQNLSTNNGGRAWYIGTRYSFGDTYQDMIDKNQVKVRRYTATEDGKLDGKPVFFTQEVWDKWKLDTGNEFTLLCQMMNNPLGGNQRIFKVENLKHYDIRPSIMNVYILVDPASTQNKRSDKTAMVVIGICQNGNKYLLDGYHHKMTITERWENLCRLHKKWNTKPGVFSVEVGYERFGMQSDVEMFQTVFMPRQGYFFDIQEVSWPREGSGAKRDRMARLEPDINHGKLLLPSIVKKSDGRYYFWRMSKIKGENNIPDKDSKNKTKVEFDDIGGECFMKLIHKHSDSFEPESMKKYPTLKAEAIVRTDENGKLYDLTLDFILQANAVPYGKHDDLVDAVSRIYDMETYMPSLNNFKYGVVNEEYFSD